MCKAMAIQEVRKREVQLALKHRTLQMADSCESLKTNVSCKNNSDR